MSDNSREVALVTGVGRREGIGFELCRQLAAKRFTVILAARNFSSARSLASELSRDGLQVDPLQLDVTIGESVAAVATHIAGSFGDLAFGLTTNNGMGTSYAVAKAALNALTAKMAHEEPSSGVRSNAVCPGFTATLLGGKAMGARPVGDGAASILWACEIARDGPAGGFFRDGKPMRW